GDDGQQHIQRLVHARLRHQPQVAASSAVRTWRFSFATASVLAGLCPERPPATAFSPVEGCADGALAIALAYRECSVAEALDAGYHEYLEARNFCATGGSAGRSLIFGSPGPAAAHGRAKRCWPPAGHRSNRSVWRLKFHSHGQEGHHGQP